MNKLLHLKTTKTYLRKINNYRRNLLKNNIGKRASDEMVKTMFEIDYKLGRIDNFDQMMGYISQKGVQARLKEVIPANKKKWVDELELLVHQGMVLQGKLERTKQLEFNL